MDNEKLTESDTYKADDNYKFTSNSWKDFRRIDWDFDSMIPSTGVTANGYEYVIYQAPDSETYFCYIKVLPGLIPLSIIPLT